MTRKDWDDVMLSGISILFLLVVAALTFRALHTPDVPTTTRLDGMTCEVLYLIDREQVTLCREGSKDAR